MRSKSYRAKRSPDTVLAVFSVIVSLMVEAPVRSDATGWTRTLARMDSLDFFVRSMAESVYARGDADINLFLEVSDMLSALRVSKLMAIPLRSSTARSIDDSHPRLPGCGRLCGLAEENM